MRIPGLRLPALQLCLALLPGLRTAAAEAPAPAHPRVFNLTDYGARGDGVTLDTAAVNQAIEACAKAGGGEVLAPAGRYLTGTIHLRSHVTFCLGPGAVILGTTNLADYQAPGSPVFAPQTRYGNWHRGLFVADNAEDITLCGPGTIDGRKVFDPHGEERMRGPHAITFAACRGLTIRDISILDAANYAIFFNVSDDVDVRNVKITGGWDGVHFRGTPDRWCHHVTIQNCLLYTGDDSIAGDYWDDAVITGCTINSSCNGIRLIGPAKHLIVSHCLFYGPGLRPHRTSGTRSNMLSGIILQPGAWDHTEGALDDVLIANNTMREVGAPITLATRPGNAAGRITISGLEAIDVYHAAFAVESWAETPITNVVLRNAHIEFTHAGRDGSPGLAVKPPGVDVRPLPAWAAYLRNVVNVTMEDVRFSLAQPDSRPVIFADTVSQLSLDGVRYPRFPEVPMPVVTTNVLRVSSQESGEQPPPDRPK